MYIRVSPNSKDISTAENYQEFANGVTLLDIGALAQNRASVIVVPVTPSIMLLFQC